MRKAQNAKPAVASGFHVATSRDGLHRLERNHHNHQQRERRQYPGIIVDARRVLQFGEQVAPGRKRFRDAESQQSQAGFGQDVRRHQNAELGDGDGAQMRPGVNQRNARWRDSRRARLQQPAGLLHLADRCGEDSRRPRPSRDSHQAKGYQNRRHWPRVQRQQGAQNDEQENPRQREAERGEAGEDVSAHRRACPDSGDSSASRMETSAAAGASRIETRVA